MVSSSSSEMLSRLVSLVVSHVFPILCLSLNVNFFIIIYLGNYYIFLVRYLSASESLDLRSTFVDPP